MAEFTGSLDAVADGLIALIEPQKAALGLTDVWYGEHNTIPRTPSLTVDPRTKTRALRETGHTVINTFEVVLTLFHSRLSSGQVMMSEVLSLAEQVEKVIHSDRKLGGLIVHGYVGRISTGFTTRNKVILKAAEIQWSGFSKTRLDAEV